MIDDSLDLSSVEKYTVNGKRIVLIIPLSVFKKCIGRHFDVRYNYSDIKSPTSNKKPCAI